MHYARVSPIFEYKKKKLYDKLLILLFHLSKNQQNLYGDELARKCHLRPLVASVAVCSKALVLLLIHYCCSHF